VKTCRLCHKPFDAVTDASDPALQAGLILARERYGDGDALCADCLVSRGRLAMMYDPEVFD